MVVITPPTCFNMRTYFEHLYSILYEVFLSNFQYKTYLSLSS